MKCSMVIKNFLIGLKHFLIYIDRYIDFYNNERIQEKMDGSC
ncbi:hypothetical protein [Filifactor alocis]